MNDEEYEQLRRWTGEQVKVFNGSAVVVKTEAAMQEEVKPQDMTPLERIMAASGSSYCASEGDILNAQTELAALHAKAAAYDEAMAAVLLTNGACRDANHDGCDLCDFIRRERAAGRIK